MPGLFHRVEDLPIEQLVPHSSIEEFHKAIHPGTPRFDEQGPHPEMAQPLPYPSCRELGSIIRP